MDELIYYDHYNLDDDLADLDKGCLYRALDALDPIEQEGVLAMARSAEAKVKILARQPMGFGRQSSLELIAKLGIWMIKNNINLDEVDL